MQYVNSYLMVAYGSHSGGLFPHFKGLGTPQYYRISVRKPYGKDCLVVTCLMNILKMMKIFVRLISRLWVA